MDSKITKLATAFSLSALAFTASTASAAEGGQYFGVQYSSVNFEIDGTDVDWSPTALVGRFGKFVNNNLAIEGRLGIGIGDDSVTADTGFGIAEVAIEVDTLLGIYAAGHHNINPTSSIYGLVGFSRGEMTISASGPGAVAIGAAGSASESETDFSFGFGANIGVSDKAGINIEYISYITKNDFDVTAISVGFVSNF